MERKQFTFYRSYLDAIKRLPKKEQGNIVIAICNYALDETEPVGLSPIADTVFTLVKPTLDASRRKAEAGKCGGKAEANDKQNGSKHKANGKQSASEKEGENEKEGEIENECSIPLPPSGGKSASKRFVPPTVSEVADYCTERHNGIDAQSFVDHYAARGWKYNGNTPMKDWKAAVRTWEHRDATVPQRTAGVQQQRRKTFSELIQEEKERDN